MAPHLSPAFDQFLSGLASDAASYVTGIDALIDGGFIAAKMS